MLYCKAMLKSQKRAGDGRSRLVRGWAAAQPPLEYAHHLNGFWKNLIMVQTGEHIQQGCNKIPVVIPVVASCCHVHPWIHRWQFEWRTSDRFCDLILNHEHALERETQESCPELPTKSIYQLKKLLQLNIKPIWYIMTLMQLIKKLFRYFSMPFLCKIYFWSVVFNDKNIIDSCDVMVSFSSHESNWDYFQSLQGRIATKFEAWQMFISVNYDSCAMCNSVSTRNQSTFCTMEQQKYQSKHL